MKGRSGAWHACAAALATGLLAAACGGGAAEPATGPGATPTPAQSGAGADGSAGGDDIGTSAADAGDDAAAGTSDTAAAPAAAADAGGDEGSGAVSEDAEPAAFETVPSAPEASDEPPEGGDSGPPPNVHDDPRGGVFVEFQRGFDRDHPFQSLDAFCLPEDLPAEELRATGAGIGAETITLVHMRTRIEEIVNLGFAAPVGDPTDMFDTYTRIVNERCGGVWGRHVDLRLVEVAVLGVGGQDIDTLRNAACIEATEGHDAVILMNTTTFEGTAQLCVTEEHDSALIGLQALPDEYVRRGGGRLLTTATTLEENLVALAKYLIDTGALEGRRVGIVAPNTPGEAEAVEGSLLAVLESAGVAVPVFDVIDCLGEPICTGGMAESVQRLAEERVDVLFPTLNAFSLPAFITEMTTQGFAPGDVQFYNSDVNSQGNEVVAGLIVTFGGPAAGELYDGTVLLVNGDSARYRTPDYPGATAFDSMCMREYAENSPTGETYDPRDPVETNKHGMVALVCSIYRVALRAIYDAGPNPTRAEIFAALENLGPVDLISMLPGSLAPGKWTMGDSLQPVTFRYPCPFEGLGTSVNICLVPSDYSELRVKAN